MRILKGGIAFFDSGIGGLTVLAECVKSLPEEIFYYYGDNKHAPYGNLPPEKIKKLVFKAFKKFRRLKIKAAVVACNTATALCVEELRKKYPFPIVGAEPAVFVAASRGGEVFSLATRATCESARFVALCEKARKRFPKTQLKIFACERLAGAIEKRLFDENFDYTPLFPKGKPNAVVLGCTHYVFLKERIATYYGCEVFDGNEGIARRLRYFVCEKNRESRPLLSPRGKRATAGRDFRRKQPAKKTKTNPLQNVKRPTVFFLGTQKNFNKHIFEQMFVNPRK